MDNGMDILSFFAAFAGPGSFEEKVRRYNEIKEEGEKLRAEMDKYKKEYEKTLDLIHVESLYELVEGRYIIITMDDFSDMVVDNFKRNHDVSIIIESDTVKIGDKTLYTAQYIINDLRRQLTKKNNEIKELNKKLDEIKGMLKQ